MSQVELPLVLLKWEELMGCLLDATKSFPKHVRFTFSGRIDAHALDVFELLIDARWLRGEDKRTCLKGVDRRLARLRALLRLSHERRYLASKTFEVLVRGLDEIGRMLGGWRRSLEEDHGRTSATIA